MGAFSLPEVKHVIRSVSYKEASEALNKVLNMDSSMEVEEYWSSILKDKGRM